MSEKLRWQHRFDNFRRAYILLQEGVERVHEGESGQRAIDQLAKEGVIKRFRFCMELSWKVIKDFLEHQGTAFPRITPRSVLREAVARKLISDGETWMKALDTRKKMSHPHTKEAHEAALQLVSSEYLPCFSELYQELALAYEQEK